MYFLVEYFSKVKPGEEIIIIDMKKVNVKELLGILDEAREKDDLITVSEIGECVLDWS